MMLVNLCAKAQEITINLRPGWNWIGYPNAMSVELNDAFGDFMPMEGDVVKSEFAFAEYQNGIWIGSLTHFMPGRGYMYCSRRTEEASFVFRGSTPQSQVFVTTAEPIDITAISAVSGGSITSNDSSYIYFIKGICWATHPNPSINDNYLEAGNGLGSFTVLMTSLTSATTYYVRAFAITETGTFYGDEMSFTTLDVPVGVINSLFSVSETQQVYFSRGNLQYRASTNTWQFANNQYDFVGSTNQYISSDFGGWIDLFGYGTSGYNNLHPWLSSTSPSYYFSYNISNTPLDWGVNNPITNGGNEAGIWRTLTKSECVYLFEIRANASQKYSQATVNGIHGIIILPDTYQGPVGLTFIPQSNGWTNNQYSVSEWQLMEALGAVFLPVAGRRVGKTVYSLNNCGYYWSSTDFESYVDHEYCYYFEYNHVYLMSVDVTNGCSVRLVQNSNQ